jgi:hypothetical protein
VIIVSKMIVERMPKVEASISSVYTITCEGRSIGKYVDLIIAEERATELTEITGKIHEVI